MLQAISPFPTVFSKDLYCRYLKIGVVWERVYILFFLLFTAQSQALGTLKQNLVENIGGKGENAGNQHFLLFPKYFVPFPKQI